MVYDAQFILDSKPNNLKKKKSEASNIQVLTSTLYRQLTF